MERRVEDSDVTQRRERSTRVVDRCDRTAVVQRRQLRQGVQLLLDGGVDDHRRSEAGAAVHDAVRDSEHVVGRIGDGRDRLDRAVARHDADLQARRAGVDDEHAFVGHGS